jgi:hypothetical protein
MRQAEEVFVGCKCLRRDPLTDLRVSDIRYLHENYKALPYISPSKQSDSCIYSLLQHYCTTLHVVHTMQSRVSTVGGCCPPPLSLCDDKLMLLLLSDGSRILKYMYKLRK